MADYQTREAEYSSCNPKYRKRKAAEADDDITADLRAALMKKMTLSMSKPSYVLALGPKMIRVENRNKLGNILRKLMRQHNWTEASGVLSMLLKGTLRDRSPMKNRLKYLASMELLEHIECGRTRTNRFKHIYDNWMRKIGSMKHWPIENRFMVHVEFILFCLQEGNVEDAHQTALCLMQEHESANDPMSNMIIGLTFRQLWYSTIPEELQWRDSLQFDSPIQSDRMINSGGCSVSNSHGADAPYQCNSDTSVMNDKLVPDDEIRTKSSFEVDHNLQVESHPQNFEPRDFYMSSAERNENETSFSYHVDPQHYLSIFSTLEGLDQLLLPVQLPHTIENWENAISVCGEFLNDHYKEAVKYLDLALNSNPPILVALLPLIQLLLIGGQYDKALYEVEKFSHNANATLPLRMRAALVEHFDRNNDELLSTCYEQILKKDPTCCHSLRKLIDMQRNGYYSLESLLEMIALHLDGTCAEYDTWKELASCFLKLSQFEEDRVSVCSTGAGEPKLMSSLNSNSNLKLLKEKNSRNAWKLRCRWWSTRYFSHKVLASEILDGNLELSSYKAACASHMYGSNFEYVVKLYKLLEERNDKDLLLFVKMHTQNSTGLFSKLKF